MSAKIDSRVTGSRMAHPNRPAIWSAPGRYAALSDRRLSGRAGRRWMMVVTAMTALTLAACGSRAALTLTPKATPFEPVPTVPASAASASTASPVTVNPAASYKKLTKRNWAKLVKAPDTYTARTYQIWGCISQFDAATGTDSFRALAYYKKVDKYDWVINGENAYFTGDPARLEDFVKDDAVVMNVISLGSYSYDTQAGGNTTVPLFQIVKITHKGSCAL